MLTIYRTYLDHDEALLLSERVSKLYVESHADVPVVARKLSTALAVSYMLPEASADGCIRQLAAIFAARGKKGPLPDQAIHDMSLGSSLERLDGDQLLSLLRFVDSLADEGCRRLLDAGPNRKLAATYQDRVQVNIHDAVELMRFLLQPSKGDGSVRARAANCFAVWALFCQKAIGVDLEQITDLRTLIRPTLVLASESYDDVVPDLQPPLDTIADLLSSYPALFKEAHLKDISELLRSAKGEQYVIELKDGNDLATPFQRLLCAYVDADLSHIVEAFDDPSMGQIMGE